MATKNTNDLAARMKRPQATSSNTANATTPSVAGAFKDTPEEYPKRLTLDLTEEQHRKFKVYAVTNGTTMNKILRDFIDSI